MPMRLACVCLGVVVGCGSSPGNAGDAGLVADAGASDGGTLDAGATDAGATADGGSLTLILGTDAWGSPHHLPATWPSAAGAWNAVNAIYSPAAGKIVFHVHRADILGGSLDAGVITAAGVAEYYAAGPATGTSDVSGTTEVYVADPDGSNPVCLTCNDAVDGQGQVALYKVLPSTTATASAMSRQTGLTVYANQNKDLATWSPDGKWIVAGVEMPRHATTHALGNSEVGFYNDLWAISLDGHTWVQLTDYASTWTSRDAVAMTPYACADPACAAKCQYRGTGPVTSPYEAYACSAAGAPPPSMGTMRPTMTHAFSGDVSGAAKLVWAERVGASRPYIWGGVLQLAKADVLFSAGGAALVNYERNLTPTAAAPGGKGLWSNPGFSTEIGAGYEPWSFSADDQRAGVATDAFHSTSSTGVTYGTSSFSEAFTDSTTWGWRDAAPSFLDTTRYDALAYAYQDNAGAYPTSKYGHWEEPTVFSAGGAAVPFIAFGSSANLTPAWDPSSFGATFGLETWVLREDRSQPALQLTQLNRPGAHALAYPTSVGAGTDTLYLSVVPSLPGSTNLPGAVYSLIVPPL
jgi:hypothetical protein